MVDATVLASSGASDLIAKMCMQCGTKISREQDVQEISGLTKRLFYLFTQNCSA